MHREGGTFLFFTSRFLTKVELYMGILHLNGFYLFDILNQSWRGVGVDNREGFRLKLLCL